MLNTWGSQKPTLGTRINWDHPISYRLKGAWLYNEQGGLTVRDLAGRCDLGVESATWTHWHANGLQNDGLFGGSHGNGAYATATPQLKIASNPTLYWRGVLRGSPEAGNPKFAGVVYDTVDTSPFESYVINATTGTLGSVGIGTNNGAGANIASADVTGLIAGQIYQFCATFPASAAATFYIDGTSRATTTALGTTIAYGATTYICGPAHPAKVVRGVNATTYEMFIWDRVLSLQEIQWLRSEPYAFMQPPRLRMFQYVVKKPTGAAPAAGKMPRPYLQAVKRAGYF